MKKAIILSSAFILLAGASANADVSVGINLGEPVYPQPVYPVPVYVEPGPGYVVAPDWPSYHYDRHRHRHDNYWARRQHDERWREEHHVERR